VYFASHNEHNIFALQHGGVYLVTIDTCT